MRTSKVLAPRAVVEVSMSNYREWARRNGRLEDIHSIDDRYDHDIDELMA